MEAHMNALLPRMQATAQVVARVTREAARWT